MRLRQQAPFLPELQFPLNLALLEPMLIKALLFELPLEGFPVLQIASSRFGAALLLLHLQPKFLLSMLSLQLLIESIRFAEGSEPCALKISCADYRGQQLAGFHGSLSRESDATPPLPRTRAKKKA